MSKTDLVSPIRLFARHPTAANLLMMIMIIAGLFSLREMNTQFFPDFGIDVVGVKVQWPGASPEDVDNNIVQALEPEVRFLDGVKRVRTTSADGLANLSIEFFPGTNMQAALSDVQTAVSRVNTLPKESEKPEIKRVERYDTISRIVISGPYPEGSLKAMAKRIRDDLLDQGIDKVDLIGSRDEEIWIKVRPDKLLQYDLKIADIAKRIQTTSKDLPSGQLQSSILKSIRSIGSETTTGGLGRVEIRALKNGAKVYLRDIADLSENFDQDQPTLERNGLAAIELHIQRALSADALEVSEIVASYLKRLKPSVPKNLSIENFDVQSDLIRSRISLLLKNGLTGLLLVIIILFLFLSVPVAIWIAVGIPVAIMATVGVMLISGQSINMVSLFGMIMALGIVVDDAIVVGEHADMQFRGGLDAEDAATLGASRMAAPVLSSSLTTIAAFTPLLIISDVIGDIIRGIPLVVIAMIIASLIECFLVLPGHLRRAFHGTANKLNPWQRRFNARFDEFRDGVFKQALQYTLQWRYGTVSIAVALLILSLGLVAGGRLNFTFFSAPEADKLYASLQMDAGTSREETELGVREVGRSLLAAEAELTDGQGGLIKFSLLKFGSTVTRGDVPTTQSQNLGGIVVELVPTDKRDIRTKTLIETWRRHIPPIVGMNSVTIKPARGGPPGSDIDVRLRGSDLGVLKKAALEVKSLLETYAGVTEIKDNLDYGNEEIILAVNARGRSLGFSSESVGMQVRNALEGAIVKRFPRGDEEVKIRIKYPEDSRSVESLDEFYLRSKSGAEVLLSEVVSNSIKEGFARIIREGGQREVSVTAETDKRITNNNKILAALERGGLKEISHKNDVVYSFQGRAEEQKQTLGDMQVGSLVGLLAIYVILAWVFASYTRPFVVMAIIPLGFVGAVLGHLLLGYDLTILSLISLVGLSGIVVNDSIILVRTIDEYVSAGHPVIESIISGTRDRLRAVILTSATTIGGLTPLLFETSLQARFLIPMAVTIIFGLAITTLLVLFVAPSIMGIQNDFNNWWKARNQKNQNKDIG